MGRPHLGLVYPGGPNLLQSAAASVLLEEAEGAWGSYGKTPLLPFHHTEYHPLLWYLTVQ